MESVSVIDYIKSKYPKMVFSPVKFPYKHALGFIISEGKLLIGYINKSGVLCKLSSPIELQSLANQGLEQIISKLPIVSGFTEIDKQNLIDLVNGSKSRKITDAEQEKLVESLKKQIADKESQYKIMFDANTNDTVLIKQKYENQIGDLTKQYQEVQASYETCKKEVLENKQTIIDNLEKYKKDMQTYIATNDLEKKDLKEIYNKVLREKEIVESNLNAIVKKEETLNADKIKELQAMKDKLDASNVQLRKLETEISQLKEENVTKANELQILYDKEVSAKKTLEIEIQQKQSEVFNLSNKVAEIKLQLENIKQELDKEKISQIAMQGQANKCKAQILSEKQVIIDKIKEYSQSWDTWEKTVNENFETHKTKIISELIAVQKAFASVLQNDTESNTQYNKLKKTINDIERELRIVIADQLVKLNAKEEEINLLKENSNVEIKERDEVIQNLQGELAKVRALLVANESEKVQLVDYDNCYSIIQNFVALNNIFYRKIEIIKRLDNIVSNNIGVFKNLDPIMQNEIKNQFVQVKEDINAHIAFLDLPKYINDPNFNYLKSKATREKVSPNFCNELTNILEYWNLNKAKYREQDNVLTNIYEDLSGAVRVYIRIKPLVGLEQKEKAVDIQLVEKKKQRFVTLDCDTAKEKVYGEFYGVFEESFTNQNVFTGLEKEMSETSAFKLDMNDILESSDSISPGLHSTFKQVEDGYSIVLFGYGISGSGKSHSLLGTRGTPGLLHYGLANLQNVASIKLRNLFEHYHGLLNINFNKMTGKIHNLVGRIPKFDQFSVDETELFKFKTGVNLNFENISVPDISILTEHIEKYRIENNRIKKTPNNPVSSRSHLYFVFQITFTNGKEGFVTLVDTAGRESPIDIFNTFIEPGKIKLASVMSPIGGQDLISKFKKNNEYTSEHIFELLKEGYFINESINHLVYFFNKKNYRTIKTSMQSPDPEKYQVNKYYVNPFAEESTINNSNNCLTIPIMNYLDNLSHKKTTETLQWRPTKFLMLCMLRQEKLYCDQTIETLQFANAVKSS